MVKNKILNFTESQDKNETESKIKVSSNQILVYDGTTGDVVVVVAHSPSLLQKNNFFSPSTGMFVHLEPVSQTNLSILELNKSVQTWPQNTVSPLIFIDSSKSLVRLATAGTASLNSPDSSAVKVEIIDSLVQVVYKLFLDCQSIKSATDESRLFFTNGRELNFERNFPQAYLDLLMSMFDHYNLVPVPCESTRVGVNSIYRLKDADQVSSNVTSETGSISNGTLSPNATTASTLQVDDQVDSALLASMVDFRNGGGFIRGN